MVSPNKLEQLASSKEKTPTSSDVAPLGTPSSNTPIFAPAHT